MTESVSQTFEMVFNSEFLSDTAEAANPGNFNSLNLVTQLILQSLKDIYIPEIILWYHGMLYETKTFMNG